MKGIIIALVIVGILLAVSIIYISQSQSPTKNMQKSQEIINPVNQPSAIQTSNNQSSQQTPTTTASTSIDIQNFAFAPKTLTIKVGDSITWTNKDATSHTVTSDQGSNSNELNSQILSQDQSYPHTFNQKGTYSYHCSVHSGMKGTIIVE